MMKRTKIVIFIAIIIFLIDLVLGVYIISLKKDHSNDTNNYVVNTNDKSRSQVVDPKSQKLNIIEIDSDEKMLLAAKESLMFIDKFHTENGYFPCEDEFYINFFNRNYTYEPDANGPFYNTPLVSYMPDCASDTDRPQKFIWFYYTLNKPNPRAFGTASSGSGGTEYRVSSQRDDPGQQYYKDALDKL